MKACLLFTVAIITGLVAGCTSPQSPSAPAAQPASSASSSPDVLIISAVYGSGTTFVDVTYRVDDLLHQPGVEFFARPEWLNADPTPGWNKALVIVYDYNGRRHAFTAGEGGKVSMEQLIEDAKKKPKRKTAPKTHTEPAATKPAAAARFLERNSVFCQRASQGGTGDDYLA